MRISGDKELVAALRILGRGVPGALVDKSMAEATRPMRDDARARARLRRQPGKRPPGGHVDEGIEFRKTRTAGKIRRYAIGGMRRARYLLHLLEFGTRPHFQPRRGIFHPGARAFPIMRPAFDVHASAVPERFGKSVWRSMRVLIAALPKRR